MTFYKEMKKLYQNKYQYKIVLILQGAYFIRGINPNSDFKKIANRISFVQVDTHSSKWVTPVLLDVIDVLSVLENYTVRVERCYLSIYFNESSYIELIQEKFRPYVSEIYTPKIVLTEGSLVSTLPYDYKVYFNVVRDKDYEGFLNWIVSNKNIRVPKSTIGAITTPTPVIFNTRYFYINGDKNLTLAKLHLGSGISRVEKIINP